MRGQAQDQPQRQVHARLVPGGPRWLPRLRERHRVARGPVLASEDHVMDLLRQATDGIRSVSADAAFKDQAIRYLTHWLSAADFAPYRPQLQWLIEQKQWPSLLDRFYQILPFGTGGRRGPVGVGPNRMNLWTLGASVQGH